MKRTTLGSGLVVLAALAVAVAAHAGKDASTIRLTVPIDFTDATAACPQGVAHYGVVWRGKTGAGQNCILDQIPADCPAGANALFCQRVPVSISLQVPGDQLDADGAIFEIWRCGDASCGVLAVEQRWSAVVRTARGAKLEQGAGTLSGGGILAFDATTFDLVTFDETLVVGP